MDSRHHRLILTVLTLFSAPALFGQNPAQSIGDILAAHRAWKTPPLSIEIAGTLTRGTVKGPIKITATREEEVLIEYGGKSQVSTSKKYFQDDGQKISYAPNLGGFNQLDVTGLFLIAQLSQRPVQVTVAEQSIVQGVPARRIHVTDNRSQKHFGQVRVDDNLDLYVSGSGLLLGLSRMFYEHAPRFSYTLAYAFSDYRETGGVLLPYRIETYLKGRKVETIDVTAYQFDVSAAPSLFLPRRTR